MPSADVAPQNFVLYDGECPVCSAYMGIAQLKRLHPNLAILNGREHPAIVAEMRAEGHEINESILVRMDGKVFSGGAGTKLISDLGSDNPVLRRTALYVLGGAPWSNALYPYLRATRNALLSLLGRPMIG